jgi:hypothetical protein
VAGQCSLLVAYLDVKPINGTQITRIIYGSQITRIFYGTRILRITTGLIRVIRIPFKLIPCNPRPVRDRCSPCTD